MAGKPKSRRDRLLEMLRDLTPAQLATLTTGLNPDKMAGFLELLRRVAAAQAKLPAALKPPASSVDPAAAEWWKAKEDELRRMFNTPLVGTVQSVRLVSDNPIPDIRGERPLRYAGDKLDAWLDQHGPFAPEESDSSLARRWAAASGKGVKVTSHHRGRVARWRGRQPKD